MKSTIPLIARISHSTDFSCSQKTVLWEDFLYTLCLKTHNLFQKLTKNCWCHGLAETKDGFEAAYEPWQKHSSNKSFHAKPMQNIGYKKNKIAVSQSNSRIFLINNYFKIYVKDFQGRQPIGYTVSWSLKKV